MRSSGSPFERERWTSPDRDLSFRDCLLSSKRSPSECPRRLRGRHLRSPMGWIDRTDEAGASCRLHTNRRAGARSSAFVKICFLSSVHPPLDKRVFEKEARSLASEGFDVVHIAPDERPGRWTENGVRIITFARARGLSGRILSLARLYRLAVREAASCYHCNEVDSWLVGVCLKTTRRSVVVFDVHEHYP